MSRSVQLGINRQHFARFLFLPRCLAPRQMPNASKWRLILIGESSLPFSKRLRIPHNLLLSRCAQCVCRGESKCVVKSDDSVNCTGGRGREGCALLPISFSNKEAGAPSQNDFMLSKKWLLDLWMISLWIYMDDFSKYFTEFKTLSAFKRIYKSLKYQLIFKSLGISAGFRWMQQFYSVW